MKKTLIALAVAASAAVSGSAMAWIHAGTSGSFNMSGTLKKVEKTIPWDVEIGAAVTAFDINVKSGQKVVPVLLSKDLPVLGIRSQKGGFLGEKGISPRIDYSKFADLDYMKEGYLPAKINVTSSDGKKIGTLAFAMRVACQVIEKSDSGENDNYMLFASSEGKGFFGGIAKKKDGVWNDAAAYSWATHLFSGIADVWDDKGIPFEGGDAGQVNFSDSGKIYQSYYASGLSKDMPMELILDQVMTSATPVPWKASLPITISYM
ncbi:cshE pilin [Shigella boydii]|nr:cshE pilin [Shigella boydii]EKE6972074.1 cshE pilin [Shigella boydii]HBD0212839.1 cshE pilin [Escherichia coli]